jgi:hypothetical protein
MMKAVKYVNSLWNIYFIPWLLLVTTHLYAIEPDYVRNLPDIFSYASIAWNGYIKDKNLACTHDRWPNALFALGYYDKGLTYIRLESKNAFQNPSLQLYSVGGGYRHLLPFGMLGGYLFLDTTFKSSASLQTSLNLCNLSGGIEGTFLGYFQAAVNFYIPLRAYGYDRHDYSFVAVQSTASGGKAKYFVQQPYYLESGNYGGDVIFSATTAVGKFPITVMVGAYCFQDAPKTIQITQFYSVNRSLNWVGGLAHQLTWQLSSAWSFYYKISIDNATRPLSFSGGIRWQMSTHHPTNPAHQKLWKPPIERHLSPVLLPETISQSSEEKAKFGAAFLEKCKERYPKKDFETIQAVFDFLEASSEVSDYIMRHKGYFFELLLDNKQRLSSLTELLFHPEAPHSEHLLGRFKDGEAAELKRRFINLLQGKSKNS